MEALSQLWVAMHVGYRSMRKKKLKKWVGVHEE